VFYARRLGEQKIEAKLITAPIKVMANTVHSPSLCRFGFRADIAVQPAGEGKSGHHQEQGNCRCPRPRRHAVLHHARRKAGK